MVKAIETCGTLADLERLVQRALDLGANLEATVRVDRLTDSTNSPVLVVSWLEDDERDES